MAATSSSKQQEISAVVDEVSKKFGYKQATPDQKKAIVAFVSGSDVFVSLPTGSGKSFCYWCLPDVFDKINSNSGQSIVLVVSPLIALMMDQVASLSKRGIKAIHVTSDLDEKAIEEIHEGKFQLFRQDSGSTI